MIVTIVTPTFNAIEFFKECIESARRGEARGIEVEHVIVDAGSTDGTVELAQSYGLRVMQGKDKGIFDAVNKGSFASSGELLGFLGADDVLLDGGLKAIVDAYRGSDKRWVVGGIRWIDDHGNKLGSLAAPPTWMVPRLHVCLTWNPMMHMATYVARDFFVELGGFNIDFKVAGDWEMFARAHARAPFQRVPAQVACFRRTGTNYSAVHRERAAREAQIIFESFGPKSELERYVWRRSLQAWLNFRNPDWLAHKCSSKVLWRLGLRERVYF